MVEIEISFIVLRGREQRPVKKLTGFEKHHTLPQRADAYHNGWVGKIAAEDIRDEMNSIVRVLRTELGYKRTDYEAHVDGTSGCITTAQYEYRTSVSLVDKKLSQVWWTRELSPLKCIADLKASELGHVFSNILEEIEVQFTRHADIEKLIDALEEKGQAVEYPFDCTYCEIELPDTGIVQVKPEGFTLTYPGKCEPVQLIEMLEMFLENGLSRNGVNVRSLL